MRTTNTALAQVHRGVSRRTVLTAMLALAIPAKLVSSLPTHAAEPVTHEVKMLNKGEAGAMVFEPASLHIEPGDSVSFVPVDKGHNAETIKDMIPAGAEPFKTALSQPFTATFDIPGVYGIRCTPHFAMGMVLLVVVGDPSANLEAAKAISLPAKPKQRFDAAFAALGL